MVYVPSGLTVLSTSTPPASAFALTVVSAGGAPPPAAVIVPLIEPAPVSVKSRVVGDEVETVVVCGLDRRPSASVATAVTEPGSSPLTV